MNWITKSNDYYHILLLTVGSLKIKLKKEIGSIGGGWYLSCDQLDLSIHKVSNGTEEEAKAAALQVISEELARIGIQIRELQNSEIVAGKSQAIAENNDYIVLKFGEVKAYRIKHNPETLALLQNREEFEMSKEFVVPNGVAVSKEMLCKALDSFNGEFREWYSEERYQDKERAKRYVMNYQSSDLL